MAGRMRAVARFYTCCGAFLFIQMGLQSIKEGGESALCFFCSEKGAGIVPKEPILDNFIPL